MGNSIFKKPPPRYLKILVAASMRQLQAVLNVKICRLAKLRKYLAAFILRCVGVVPLSAGILCGAA